LKTGLIKRFRKYLSAEGAYLLMLAPLLIFVIIVAIYPLAFSIFISFFKYRLTDPDQTKTLIGIANYQQAFKDPIVVGSLKTTMKFVVGTVVVELALGLGLALLFSAETRFMRFTRSFLLIPMALPPLVVALVFKALYNTEFGVIPFYLKQMNIDVGRGLLAELSTALPAVMLVDIWQWTPLIMFIFLAGIKSLPTEPYEAAIVDGASRWQSFIHITLPLLKPTLLVALLLRTMQSFKVFDIIYATTAGGPGTSTTVLNFQIYKVGLTFFNMGYAAALANILLFIVAILSVFYVMTLERQQL
jgi:multiple sugar transport system permease protein